MSRFREKFNEVKTGAEASKRVTFSEADFNALGTALLNEHDYETEYSTVKNGEHTIQNIKPIEGLRESVIGSVLKAAGVDAADRAKIIQEHQFPTLPLYKPVSEMMEKYLDAGKAFTFVPKDDLIATLTMQTVPEEIKEVRAPMSNESTTKRYAEHRIIKCKSNCPSHRKTKVD